MTVLVLSGTAEGRQIAAALHATGTRVIASLAGATRRPNAQGVETRIGGFGGTDGFETFLQTHAITAVLDATHPFASSITHRSSKTCAQLDLPYCIFSRPAWQPVSGDQWTRLTSEAQACEIIQDGATIFLATGRQSLEKFANLTSCHLICRQIDPPDGLFPFPNGQFLIGRPPFSVADEVALFKSLDLDWLIVKNAGGAASYSKLDAARLLGLKVAMIERPPLPEALVLSDLEDAIQWGISHG